MASNIMPFNSISVKVVQNSHTGFFFSVLLDLFTVVGLAARRLESAKKRLENEAWHGSHLSGMCPLFIKTFSRTKELTPWVWKSIFKERPLIRLLAHYSADCFGFRVQLPISKPYHLPSSEGPIMESSSVGGIQSGLIGRPKPSIDTLWEEIGSVTAIKVAQTSWGPNVLNS